jgi:hypothetical protein
VTNLLKQLLNNYGLLYITVMQLQQERPGASHTSLQEYDTALGAAEPGEPVVVVRVSRDGQARVLTNVDSDAIELAEEYSRGSISVLELPEDEYFFFRAFRPGIFELQSQLPAFFFAMSFVYGYTLFETYISDVVRCRLKAFPAHIGRDKQITVAEILDSESKEELVEQLVNREVNRIMYEPIGVVLDRLRNRLGFRALTTQYDGEITRLSLIRNCVLHNACKVDQKLSGVDSSLLLGQPIELQASSFSSAINVLRKLALAVDIAFEELADKLSG